MYAYVSSTGAVSFRYDYRINGRRETLVIGKYSRDGISLSVARERCLDARHMVREGISPAKERQRENQKLREARSLGQFAEIWFRNARMAESTKAMRRVIYDRDISPTLCLRLLKEIKPEDVRSVCLRVKDRGAPATAIHVRDIIKQIYAFARLSSSWDLSPSQSQVSGGADLLHANRRAIGVEQMRAGGVDADPQGIPSLQPAVVG